MPFLRLLAAILALSFALAPAGVNAQVTIFSPFNVPGSVDENVRVLAKDVPYADGARQKLDIYGPSEPQGLLSPVVMFIYGGSWRSGDKFEYEFVCRGLAAQGFVCVIADYRLFPEVKYPQFLNDCAQAVKWIEDNITNYGGDTKRFFLAGHSAGAYNAVMLGLDKSFLHDFNVTMPIRGVASISGPFDFYPFEYQEVIDAFGSADNPEGTQPINLVTPDEPPFFLASGTSDPIVRVQNTQNLAKKLKADGDWVTEKYYEGFGHLAPVIAMGAMWRFTMPILSDMVDFFRTFGAFPSGTPKPVYTPAPPDPEAGSMADIVTRLDKVLAPISTDRRDE